MAARKGGTEKAGRRGDEKNADLGPGIHKEGLLGPVVRDVEEDATGFADRHVY